MIRSALLAALALTLDASASAQSPAFPLKYSENRRYFVDQSGKPFLYHADTAWQIYSRLTFEEAREYIEFRKKQGFNTIQTQIVNAPEHVNRYGRKAFGGNTDFAQPDEAYHDHVARVNGLADSLGMLIVMSQPWLGCCQESFGNRPDKPIQANGPEKNRGYGRYLGKKFGQQKNLLWIVGGDNDPKDDLPGLEAFAEGLSETAPAHHLLTYHGSPPHSSTDLFQYAPWLGFSFIYTYWRDKPGEWVFRDYLMEVYEAALREYHKTRIMPFVLGESQYEGHSGNDIGTPYHVRRQAYWTMLCGGAGHAYGSQTWNFPANWREMLQWPGATQLQHFINLFSELEWWKLVPDERHQFVVSGYGTFSMPDFVTTALSSDGKVGVSYLPERQTIVADLARLKGARLSARWYDPRTGESHAISDLKPGLRQFTPPSNGDWVLVIRAE